MSDILIHVGASLDRSTSTVFAQLGDMARRANRTVEAEAKRAAQSETQAWRQAERDLARLEREKVRETKASAQARSRASKEAAQEEARSAKEASKEAAKAERDRTREAETEARRRMQISREETREREQAMRQGQRAQAQTQRARSQFTREALGLAGRGAMALGHFGASVLGDIAQGAGVNFSMASQFANAQQMQQAAVQLANQGYMPGELGPNGQRVDPKELQEEAYRIGTQTGTSANDVMGAMSAFVGRTGDLQAARESMADLAKLSAATGTNIQDMADAAGDVSNQLGDVPEKGKLIGEVMKAVAGQGKLGAVEIKDLANQMAKVAANANLMEGNAADNIKLFGAFAQEARLRGGAASPQQAATSITALMDTFSKGARLHAFANMGIRTSGEGGKVRNVQDILIEALQKTQKGSASATNEAFGSLFASAQARRGVRGFESIFRSTYASTSGSDQEKLAAATRAVNEEFTRLKAVAISEQELRESFAAVMQTGQAQANSFNNEMQKLAGEVSANLLPALVSLSPAIISLSTKIADGLAKMFPPDVQKAAEDEQKNAAKVSGTVNKLLNRPDQMSEEDYSMAQQLLTKQQGKLGTSIEDQKADLAQKKEENAGGIGTTLKDLFVGGVGKTVEDLGKGDISGIASGWGFAKKAIAGRETMQKGRASAIEMGESSLAQSEAQKKQIEDQLQTLRDLHSLLKGGTIQVKVVEMPKQGAGTTPPNAKGPQNEGLAAGNE